VYSNMAEETKETPVQENNNNVKKEQPKRPATDTWDSHLQPHGELIELFPGRLWIVEGIMPKKGPKRNMVVYKMTDNNILLHSVVVLNPETMTKLLALGTPTIMIVPNGQHSYDAGVYKERFPDILVVSPRHFVQAFPKRVAIERAAEELFGDAGHNGVKYVLPDGVKGSGGFGVAGELMYELSLGDNGEKAIVATDLFFNNPPTTHGLEKVFFGSQFMTPRLIRWGVLGNTPRFKAWVEKLLTEAKTGNVKAFCVAHGAPVTGEHVVPALENVVKNL